MLTHRMEGNKIVMSEYLFTTHFFPSFIPGKITTKTTEEMRVVVFQNGLSILSM